MKVVTEELNSLWWGFDEKSLKFDNYQDSLTSFLPIDIGQDSHSSNYKGIEDLNMN